MLRILTFWTHSVTCYSQVTNFQSYRLPFSYLHSENVFMCQSCCCSLCLCSSVPTLLARWFFSFSFIHSWPHCHKNHSYVHSVKLPSLFLSEIVIFMFYLLVYFLAPLSITQQSVSSLKEGPRFILFSDVLNNGC